MDDLANPSLLRPLPIALVVVAAVGAAMCLSVLWTRRRFMASQTRVFRIRVAVVGLFIAVAAIAAFALLAMPLESETGARPAPVAAGAESRSGQDGNEGEVVSARRFSSAKLPALSLDAPDGWTLEAAKAGHKLAVTSAEARLVVSTAILTEAVNVEALLRQLAGTQRALGFEVGPTFSDRIGDLPAAGFLATGPARSVCTWMVRRDAHLVSSAICTADGKRTAREACRAPLANLRWRAPGR